jgi:hypothetical protein
VLRQHLSPEQLTGDGGHLLYQLLPTGLIKPTRCLDIVHGLGALERKLGVIRDAFTSLAAGVICFRILHHDLF